MDVGQLIATLRKDVLPKSPLGQALSYAENQWPAMARYLEVAHAELDNNSTEHALRAVVLGRRNWLHVGQEAGGEKAANLFSLMITCKRLGVYRTSSPKSRRSLPAPSAFDLRLMAGWSRRY